MKELNLNGFYKMCDKFSSYHKLDENETRRLYAFIGENFDDDFTNYDIEADKSWHSICSHMFAMCSWMAFGSLEFPLLEKALFSERDFTHADFFNVAWYFGVMSRLNSSYVLFLDHIVSELNSVTNQRLLQHDWSEFADGYSEVEVYDFLVEQNTREASLIMANIEADFDAKTAIKQSVLSKDEDRFVGTVISSDIDLSNIAGYVKIHTLVEKIKFILPVFVEILLDNDSSDNCLKDLMNVVENSDDNRDEDENKVIGIINRAAKGKQSLCVPNISWYNLYEKLLSHDSTLLELHHLLKGMTSDIDIVDKLDELIESDPYLTSLVNRSSDEEIDYGKSAEVSKQLEDFRDKFIQQMTLPPNIIGKSIKIKNSKEYIESDYKQDQWYCIKLYNELVKANLLDYDENVFYSFLCRMSNDYKGEHEPDKIVWRGRPSELFHFLYWFSNGGDGRIPSKASEFFLDPEGKPFKKDGVKSFIKGDPPERVKSIISKNNHKKV